LTINQHPPKIASTGIHLLLHQKTTTIIIGPSIIMTMKMIIITIESMKEIAVLIDIIIEDPLLPLKEEEEKKVVTDTMKSIIGRETTTNKSIMKMNTDMVEKKMIQGRVVIIITESILSHYLIQGHNKDWLNLIQSIIMSLEETR
jgi:hypothetical protein